MGLMKMIRCPFQRSKPLKISLSIIPLVLPFLSGPMQYGTSKERERKKEAILLSKRELTRECTINIHKHVQRTCTSHTKRSKKKCTMMEMETPDVHTAKRLNKAIWIKGKGMYPTVFGYVCSENITNIKICQGSSIHWSPM